MPTLNERIEACSGGSVIVLDGDVEEEVVVGSGKKLTLDLGGHTLTAPAGVTPLTVLGADITVRNGKILSTGDSNGIRVGKAGATEVSKARLESDLTVVSEEGCGVLLCAKAFVETGANVSNVKAGFAAISGNGNQNNWYNGLTVFGGSVTSPDTAIYWPQVGDLKILGGELVAPLGIEIRAGQLYMSGGTVRGTGVPVTTAPNGSGSTSSGCGIAVAQHTTKQPISVTIAGGVVEGYSAVYESNPQNNPAADISKVGMNIVRGTFNAINGGTVAVHSEDCTGFVRGGAYNTPVDASMCADGFEVIKQSDGSYVAVVTAWTFPDGGVTGGGLMNMRRLVMSCNRLQYTAGGISLPTADFRPYSVLSASAKGGLTGYYDAGTNKVVLYRGSKEVSGTLEDVTLIMVGH